MFNSISLGEVVTFAILVAGAAIYIVSAIRKTRTTELAELAETRGNRISDLEKELRSVETRLAKLEGAYAGLQALKVTEIADEILSRLDDAGVLK